MTTRTPLSLICEACERETFGGDLCVRCEIELADRARFPRVEVDPPLRLTEFLADIAVAAVLATGIGLALWSFSSVVWAVIS